MGIASGMQKTNPKDKKDFKQSPELCTHALLKEYPDINNIVLDPCCGCNPIGNVLRRYNINVCEYDLSPQDGSIGYDFLSSDYLSIYDIKTKNKKFDKKPTIIMNPPFGLKKGFILKAIEISDITFCLLSMQAVNFNDFSREILELREYRGRLKMIPKFFMTENYQIGLDKRGGNAQYAWFIFSKTKYTEFGDISFEKQIDLDILQNELF